MSELARLPDHAGTFLHVLDFIAFAPKLYCTFLGEIARSPNQSRSSDKMSLGLTGFPKLMTFGGLQTHQKLLLLTALRNWRSCRYRQLFALSVHHAAKNHRHTEVCLESVQRRKVSARRPLIRKDDLIVPVGTLMRNRHANLESYFGNIYQ
jgi:hypothetical protein